MSGKTSRLATVHARAKQSQPGRLVLVRSKSGDWLSFGVDAVTIANAVGLITGMTSDGEKAVRFCVVEADKLEESLRCVLSAGHQLALCEPPAEKKTKAKRDSDESEAEQPEANRRL